MKENPKTQVNPEISTKFVDIRQIRRYALLVFFCPALWRYGVLFSRKRYGVMDALKKALWRYEGPPAAPLTII